MEEEIGNVRNIGVYTKNEVVEELVALFDCSTIGAPDCGRHDIYGLYGNTMATKKKSSHRDQ